MYEMNSQSTPNHFWLNVGLMILIAGLFAAGLYYYQRQVTDLQKEVKNLEQQLASLTDSDSSVTEPEFPVSTDISQEQAITSGTRELPKVALTFDADMTASMKDKGAQWYDPKIIEILKEKEVPATFFLTGMWVETYPEAAKQLADSNLFEVESHSYQTKSFSQPCYELTPLKSKEEKEAAIEKAQQAIKDVTGVTPAYFRFPGGCYEQQDLKLVNDLGLKAVQWDVISEDAFAESASSIVNKTLEQTQNGSIIVFHLGGPNAPHTAEALEEIISSLKEKGYRFTTVHPLLNPPTVYDSE